MDIPSYLLGKKAGGGSGGTTDYSDLSNKPQINSVELSGNKSLEDLSIQEKLSAGTNITIGADGKTISATDTTYSNATTESAGLMSSDDKTKLNGIASGAEVNVQANWNESNSASDSYIQNKPTIPDIVQYSTIPTASSSTVGKIIQYTGTTDANYTNGYFYIGVSDGALTPTYSWENLNVQNSSGGGADLESKGFLIRNYSNLNMITNRNYTSGTIFDTLKQLKLDIDNLHTTYNLDCFTLIISGLNGSYFYYPQVMSGVYVGNEITFYQYYNFTQSSSDDPILLSLRLSNSIIRLDTTGSSLLRKNNQFSYNVTSDYNPAHKKYVDDSISSAIGSINTVLATLTTPSNNGGN